jgi:hypothetical protein
LTAQITEGRPVTAAAAQQLVAKAMASAIFRKALAETPEEALRAEGFAADDDAIRFAESLGGDNFIEAARKGTRRSPAGRGGAKTGNRRKTGTTRRKSPLRKGEANTNPSRRSGGRKKPKSPLGKGEATAGTGRKTTRKRKSPLRKGEATAGATRRGRKSPLRKGEATAGAGRKATRKKPRSGLARGEATAGPRRSPRRKRSPVGTGEANT